MTNNQFWQGIDQFNQREFYACHDTLEALWMEACDPEKTFYQGILQIAVGCYHLSNHNWNGSVMLLGEGIRRLRNYQPSYNDINVRQLVEQSASMLSLLQQAGPEKAAQCADRFGLTGESEMGATTLPEDRTWILPKIDRVTKTDE
ncbi:MAG: DUF309 domain-containing protein [Geitlerinemataceae cyanobacterium]